MSSKLVKKLKKDLKKSPGKAAMLAMLSVVAIWFWAPLVTNLFGGGSKPVANSAMATASSTTTAIAVAAPTPNQTTTNWKQIAEAIEQDPRTKPAKRLALTRDPFRPVEPEKPKETAKSAKPAPQPVALDIPPAKAGLVLSGTIVGASRSVARLNGKNYAKGDLVKAPASAVPLSYRVVNVDGRSVTLALGDNRYELKMPGRRSDATAGTGSGLQESLSSDSPDFDPSILESLN